MASWSCIFSFLKFVKLFNKITPPIINTDHGKIDIGEDVFSNYLLL